MLLIWDLDGTLRSISWEGLFAGYQAMITAAGKNWRDFFRDFKEFIAWNDLNYENNIRRIFGTAIVKEKEVLGILFQAYNQHVQIFPWADETLTKLRLKNRHALLTSSYTSSALATLGPLDKHFALIVGGDQVPELKPRPNGIYYIWEKCPAAKEETLIIGDSQADIEAGRTAGILTGLVGWTVFGDPQVMVEELKPDFFFAHPSELLTKIQ